jgi:aquaporin TIP
MKSRALWAEFVGTFALIFVGMMAIATNEIQKGAAMAAALANSKGQGMAAIHTMMATGNGDIGRVGIALAHGFAIAVMVSATMAASGGHLNPAVTFGMWVGKRITLKRMLGYWVVQLAGGVAGAFVANAVLPSDALTNATGHAAAFYGLPSVSSLLTPDEGGMVLWGMPIYAVLIEAVLTFFLVYVVLGTAVDKRAHKIGGLMIGLTITLDILAGGPLTGAAMNPARWFGPAFLVSGQPMEPSGLVGTAAYANWPVYIIGPLLGAAIAAFLYGREPEEEEATGDIAEYNAGMLPR